MAIFKRCANCGQLYQGKYCKACANKLSKENQELRLENARLEFSILALKEQIAELTKESEDDLK